MDIVSHQINGFRKMPRNAVKRLNYEEHCLPTTKNNNKFRKNSSSSSSTNSSYNNNNNKIDEPEIETIILDSSQRQQQQQTHKKVKTQHLFVEEVEIIPTIDLEKATTLAVTTTDFQKGRSLFKFIQKREKILQAESAAAAAASVRSTSSEQQVVFEDKSDSGGEKYIEKLEGVKAPQKQRGRRRNWRKGRFQKKAKVNKKEGSCSTTTSSVSSVCYCNSAEPFTAGTVGVVGRGRVCGVCSEQGLKDKKRIDNVDDDSADCKYSAITITTTADLTIEPTIGLDNEPSTSEQKNNRLLSLRLRKKEEEAKKVTSVNIKQTLSTTNEEDPQVLNRIDIFVENEDVKANGTHNQNKRKRFNNCSTITTRGRRAATQKYYTESESILKSAILAVGDIVTTTTAAAHLKTVDIAVPKSTTLGISPNITTTLSAETTILPATATRKIAASPTAGRSTTRVPKRRRVMSLYDRHQQNSSSASGGRGIDTDLSGRNALISNGYLNTGRGSGTLSISAGLQDAAEIAESATYYLPGSNPNSNAIMANGPTLNHAPSMATLCNIGNTCYLNSVVYTLRFAPQFLHNLHHLVTDLDCIQQHLVRQRAKSASLGRGCSGTVTTGTLAENSRSWSSKDLLTLEQQGSARDADIMKSKKSGGGGGDCLTQKTQHQLLVEKLHEVYECLHRNEVVESTEPHHADTLLQAMQDVYTTFAGNQQQDAHEFLMCVLNSLRETSQLLIKAIGECPDVIANGFIANPNDFDAERDNSSNSSQALLGSTTTSLSSSSGGGGSGSNHITKASFFSRKPKRKEDSKSTKNARVQSPLKDILGTGSQQQTSQSLFYLNSKELNNGSDGALAATAAGLSGGSDEESKTNTQFSKAPMFKTKEALAAKIRELGLDFFREDFEGVTVATTKCLSCETITEQRETMIDISVPVPAAGFDASEHAENPTSFIQNSCVTREYFRGENKYRCEQCIGYTEAIRSVSYEVLPRLLVIQLSRFSGGMEKISSHVPTNFILPCFCSKCCELSEGNKLHVYKLYSVITHVGATMTVGHYIAYTCSLDWANEYINCPKERQRAAAASAISIQQQSTQQQGNGSVSNILLNSSAASAAASAIASSGTSLIKKMKFGRSKASSSGDITKNVSKNLNGLTVAANKGQYSITNGISKLSVGNTSSGGSSSNSSSQTPTTCYSLNCCATRLCTVHQMQQQQQQQQQSDESQQNGYSYNSYPSSYGSTGRGSSAKSSYHMAANLSAASGCASEPIWYMCDDDKIKAMPQREFEDLLSPSRKVTITPYLLFYARFDLQSTNSSSTDMLSTGSSTSCSTLGTKI